MSLFPRSNWPANVTIHNRDVAVVRRLTWSKLREIQERTRDRMLELKHRREQRRLPPCGCPHAHRRRGECRCPEGR